MTSGYKRYVLDQKLRIAEAALSTAEDKLYARIEATRHINEPAGYSVKRWADSVEMHQRRVTDVQHEINNLGVDG